MKKNLVVAIAAIFVVGLLCNMGIADEMLSLRGEVRARGWSFDNVDSTPFYATGYRSEDKQKYEFWDQRFRVQSTISPAEGVKGVLRIDFAETKWGDRLRSSYIRPDYGTGYDVQLDRAYLDITKGIVNVTAGLQFYALGSRLAYSKQTTGIQAVVKTPVTIHAGFLKLDEGEYRSGSYNLKDDEDDNKDLDQYFIDLGYKNDMFQISAFYAVQNDGGESPNEPVLYGVHGMTSIGPVKIEAEIDMFGGTVYFDEKEYDVTGTNLYLNGSMAVSDAITAGVYLIYSSGNDDDDKVKLYHMPNAVYGDLQLADYGLLNAEIFPLGEGHAFNPLVGPLNNYNGDPTGASGSIGGGPYIVYKPLKDLTIWGQALFLTADKDDLEGKFKSASVYNLSAEYELVKNAFIGVHYMYANADKVDEDTDSGTVLGTMLRIRF